MKKLFITLVLFSILGVNINSFSQIGWVTQQSGTSAAISGLSFVNNMTGRYCGYGGVIGKTSNGGLNWIVSLANPSSSLNCITFTDLQKGWTAGYNGVIYSTEVVDTASGNYFPLQVGNVYKYYTWDFQYPNSGTYSKARITKDTIAFGNRYFYCYNFPYILNGWVRYDSLSGLLLHLYPGNGCGPHANDRIIDSLTAKITNTLNYFPYSNASFKRCADTMNTTLFGYYTTKTKLFNHDGLVMSIVNYAKNIGISNYGTGEPPPVSHFVDLIGCYVNGIMYGDTILTNINQISTEIPSAFSLSQNYPNPFNPVTKIKFAVPSSLSSPRALGGDLVLLKVYDIMGREVQTLVNERLQPGTYEATFDGSALNSGVYFYKLVTEGFTETKKMTLIK